MYSADILKGAGFPACEGWYATTASPHVLDDPKVEAWVKRFAAKFGKEPEDYSITAYDAALVILDAVRRVAAAGKEVNRDTVRDAIESAHLNTLQGEVSFDKNGDIRNHVVSVFQIVENKKYPLDDPIHQYKYIGEAPASV